MKKIYLILLLILLLTCKSTVNLSKEIENIKIWEITSYTINEKELIGSNIKNVYFKYNIGTKKSYLTYFLNAQTTNDLEEEWKKSFKKIRLDRVHIVDEIKYRRRWNRLEITDVKKDFIIEGINTNRVQEKINKIIYTERLGESEGLIPLLYRIWNPTVIEQIPYPQIKTGDTFFLKSDGDYVTLSSEGVSITLKFIGEHQWIGY